MPWLHSVFPVLKHNLDKRSEIGAHDRSLEVARPPSGAAGDAINTKNSRNIKVICQFQWGVCGNKRNAIDCISLLSINNRGRVH